MTAPTASLFASSTGGTLEPAIPAARKSYRLEPLPPGLACVVQRRE